MFSNKRATIQGSGKLELPWRSQCLPLKPGQVVQSPPDPGVLPLLRSGSHGAPAPKHTTSPHVAKHCGRAFIPLHNLRSQPWVPSPPGVSHLSALTHRSVKLQDAQPAATPSPGLTLSLHKCPLLLPPRWQGRPTEGPQRSPPSRGSSCLLTPLASWP